MKRKLLLCWVLLFCGSLSLFAANVPADSALITTKRGPRFVFNFDTRYTLLQHDQARISGLKAGLEWRNLVRTGFGYYALSTPIITKLPAVAPDKPEIEARVKFSYAAVYAEYVFLKNKRWEISAPVQLGYGKTLNVYRNGNGQIQRTEKIPLWLVETSLAGHYKVYSWIGLGAGVGYRQMLNDPQRETRYLNAPIYYVKVKLFAGDLYRLLRLKYCPTQTI